MKNPNDFLAIYKISWTNRHRSQELPLSRIYSNDSYHSNEDDEYFKEDGMAEKEMTKITILIAQTNLTRVQNRSSFISVNKSPSTIFY